jgi:hypothetical protein
VNVFAFVSILVDDSDPQRPRNSNEDTSDDQIIEEGRMRVFRTWKDKRCSDNCKCNEEHANACLHRFSSYFHGCCRNQAIILIIPLASITVRRHHASHGGAPVPAGDRISEPSVSTLGGRGVRRRVPAGTTQGSSENGSLIVGAENDVDEDRRCETYIDRPGRAWSDRIPALLGDPGPGHEVRVNRKYYGIPDGRKG